MTARGFQSAGRGFTLLEVMLASSVGLMMVIGAVSLVFMFERTNERLDRRFRESTDLQRTRLVMDRTFSTMLMSQATRAQTPAGVAATPTDGSGAAGTAGTAGTAGAAGTRSAGGTGETGRDVGSTTAALGDRLRSGIGSTANGKSGSGKSGGAAGADPNKPGASGVAGAAGAGALPIPPRIMLGPGPMFPQSELREPPAPDSGRKVAERRMMQPQRLEIVLSASPVPSSGIRSQIAAAARSRSSLFEEPESAKGGVTPAPGAAGAPGEEDDDLSQPPIKAVRGAFELRPLMETRKDGTRSPRMMSNGGPVWELWWVPLPPRDPEEPEEEDPLVFQEKLGRAVVSGELDPPYKISSNIAWMEWRMFQERERKRFYSAATWAELPAYVEVEVETVGGMSGNWLFEVSADQGPEVAARPTDEGRDTGAAEEGAEGSPSGAGSGAKRSPAPAGGAAKDGGKGGG